MTSAGFPNGKRCEELARRECLFLADIIELTGQAPDRDGQIGILDVDEGGLRFSLTEEKLRRKPAAEQLKARRLISEGRLDFPCTPPALVSFNKEWGEFALPERFVRAVEVREASIAGDRWRDGLIADLRSRGLATVRISYFEFLKLTTFSLERHLANGQYELLREKGQVTGLVAGKAWEAISDAGDLEHQIAAEFMENGRLDFPVAAELLVRWMREQGLGTVEFSQDPLTALTALRDASVDAASREQSKAITKNDGEQPPSLPKTRTNSIREEIIYAIQELGGNEDPGSVRKKLFSYAGKPGSKLRLQNDRLGYLKNGRFQELDVELIRKRIKRLPRPLAAVSSR